MFRWVGRWQGEKDRGTDSLSYCGDLGVLSEVDGEGLGNVYYS